MGASEPKVWLDSSACCGFSLVQGTPPASAAPKGEGECTALAPRQRRILETPMQHSLEVELESQSVEVPYRGPGGSGSQKVQDVAPASLALFGVNERFLKGLHLVSHRI